MSILLLLTNSSKSEFQGVRIETDTQELALMKIRDLVESSKGKLDFRRLGIQLGQPLNSIPEGGWLLEVDMFGVRVKIAKETQDFRFLVGGPSKSKPVNHILDPRVRQAPFLKDGSCAG